MVEQTNREGGAVDSIFVGAAEGYLGRHTVLHFLRKGYRVHGTVLREPAKAELLAWLEKNGAAEKIQQVAVHPVDLSNLAEVGAAVAKVRGLTPDLKQAVNCAGGFEWVKVVDANVAKIQFLLTANYLSNWTLMKSLLPWFAEQRQGCLVVISAAASKNPVAAGMGPYIASKAALNVLVDAANVELASSGVRVGAVYPTIIDTPRNREDMPSADLAQWMPVTKVIELIEKQLRP